MFKRFQPRRPHQALQQQQRTWQVIQWSRTTVVMEVSPSIQRKSTIYVARSVQHEEEGRVLRQPRRRRDASRLVGS